MSKYRIEDMKVKVSPQEIIETYESVISKEDVFGEYVSAFDYLPYEHVKPYLNEGVTEAEWKQKGDADLVEDFKHYADWWLEKIRDERGISVHRGKAQFVIRMFLAGCPEWKEIWDMDGGWYQRTAYAEVAELFGLPSVEEEE